MSRRSARAAVQAAFLAVSVVTNPAFAAAVAALAVLSAAAAQFVTGGRDA